MQDRLGLAVIELTAGKPSRELDMAHATDVLKNYRDIGAVVSPIEQLMEAREHSSCCVGQEAMLESGRVPRRRLVLRSLEAD